MNNILEQIGLTPNQATIYLALLTLGEASAQQIIKESGLHRSRVYDSLEMLSRKGIVSSVIRDFKHYFQAIDPDKLLEQMEEKKEALRQALPELKRLECVKKEEIHASVYKGREGLKAIHVELLKENKDIFVLGAKGLIFSEFPYFIPNLEREMKKRDVKMICLFDNKEALYRARAYSFVHGKLLPPKSDSSGVVNICGTKVVTVLWKEKHPTAFMIDNKDIAISYKKWFNLLWKSIK